MTSLINFRTAVLLISSFLAVAWQGLKADVWRASDPTYVPFAVLDMIVSSDNRMVGLTVVTNGKEPQSTNDIRRYLLDVKTGEHRLLGPEGTLLPVANAPETAMRWRLWRRNGLDRPIRMDGSSSECSTRTAAVITTSASLRRLMYPTNVTI
jgi:hypothetical protein